MPKGTFMIYIFLEDYIVNENATLLKSNVWTRRTRWISLDL
jgi:hypothetical protein